MNGMAWMMKVDPSKYKGQRIGSSSKAQDSSFYILVIQDHIDSRNSQYYQGGMRCCLMSLLLHVLCDMLQNPQLLSHIHK